MVNQPLTSRQLLLITLGFLILLSLWLSLFNMAHNVAAPTYLHATAENTVIVRVGDRVIELDSRRGPVNAIDLAELGIDGGFSDVVMPARDRLLLWVNAREASWAERDGLYQCQPGAGRCSLFSDAVSPDQGVFRLHWQPDVGLLVVTRFSDELLLLDDDGELLAGSAATLREANSVYWHQDRAWVADANNHRISVFRLDRDRLVEEAPISMARDDGRRWPTTVLPVQGAWWVLIADGAMSSAALATWRSDWQPRWDVPLPANVDITAMVPFGEHIMLADMSARRLYQVSVGGEWLGEVDAGWLSQDLEDLQYEHLLYRLLSWLVGGLFILIPLLVVVVVLWRQRHAEPQPAVADTEYLGDAPERWLASTREVQQMLRLMPWLAGGLLIATLYFAVDWQEPALPLMMFAMIGLLGVGSFYMRDLAACAVGIRGEQVLLRDQHGKVVAGQGDEIASNGNVILIGERMMILGNHQMRFVDSDQVKQLLEPRLRRARKPGQGELLRVAWRQFPSMRWFLAATLLVLVPVLVVNL